MKKLGLVALVAVSMATAAAPVSAGVGWSWDWDNACGGNAFITCMSGSIAWSGSGDNLVVTVQNESPFAGDVFTAVGLINMPAGLSPVITADDLTGWDEKNNYVGVNGPLPPATYAISTNGIGDGFGEDGLEHQFTFTFAGQSDAWFTALEDVLGVGVHAQSGPNDCSAKVGVTSAGAIDNFDGQLSEREGCGVSVPEPASAPLLLTGIVGMGFLAARRRRNELEA